MSSIFTKIVVDVDLDVVVLRLKIEQQTIEEDWYNW